MNMRAQAHQGQAPTFQEEEQPAPTPQAVLDWEQALQRNETALLQQHISDSLHSFPVLHKPRSDSTSASPASKAGAVDDGPGLSQLLVADLVLRHLQELTAGIMGLEEDAQRVVERLSKWMADGGKELEVLPWAEDVRVGLTGSSSVESAREAAVVIEVRVSASAC